MRRDSRAGPALHRVAARSPDQTFSSRLSEIRPVGLIASISNKRRENDDIDQTRIEILRRVTFDQTDNKPGENCSFHIAEAADNDDGKGFHDDRGSRKRSKDENRREHCTGHAGKCRRDDECQHDELVGIDTHQPGSLAVLRHRAQCLAQKCKFHKRVEQCDGYGGNRNDDDTLPGYEDPGKADDLAAVWCLERVGDRPEPRQHQILHHDRNADRGNQRQQFIALATQWRKNRCIDQPAQHSADHETQSRY